MTLIFVASLAAVGLFLGMLMLFEVGRFIGKRRLTRDPDGAAAGAGPAEAAVFGLLGLLLAFTFSGAASRFEDRRHLITQEANAIGTAYLRVDLLPSAAQPELRQLFRRYVDDRVESYRHLEDATATQARRSDAATLQAQIWTTAVSASQQDVSGNAAKVLLPALNEMFDITTTRVMASENHPPRIIFVLLAGLSLISALLVGYVTCATRPRHWPPFLILAATLSVTFYVILDLEFPRQGMIRVDSADHVLAELRKSMK